MEQNGSVIIPTMRYKDAVSAIEWLCNTFGFEKHLVIPGENKSIAHAQLVFGNAMIMVSSIIDNDYGKLMRTPKDLDGFITQAPYIVVKEIDEHYKGAIASGAIVVMEIKDEDYGGRGYSCKDPEGHLWNFGSYDPWIA
jgi:uncharacterized glyoxalase superfamily protein PhnB